MDIKDAASIRAAGSALRALLEGFLSPTEPHEETAAFPEAGVDAFLSHFIIAIRFLSGKQEGQLLTLSLPAAVQTVARSERFVYGGAGQRHLARLPIPPDSTLTNTISENDFVARPRGFFQEGKEHVWLQILNLDAKADTKAGPVRIILGETFKREYSDVFERSLGVAESIGGSGFPARLFFSPNAVIETPFGALKTRAGKALVGARITSFPPIGSFPNLLEPVPLDPVDDVRAALKRADGDIRAASARLAPVASIVGLAHPIDASLSLDEPFRTVERAIG